ncbi:hypothetical protein F0562_003435 [Nyssa sinensis]|uniref:Beta-catenin-like protein 1 N-terminal domain-containing protein n=1 Tax=Nyssa sinensis TaxID=561372 RepID=A0A5J5BWH5_9ASTE|nr:hypothetical protein F0562_003435 [Nyssa sinensis]
MNGVDVVLQAVALYKSRDLQTPNEEMVENLFDYLCCSLMPLENNERFVEAKGVELMIIIMNQQRNQIFYAVVIARILGVALVVPILQVNVNWGEPIDGIQWELCIKFNQFEVMTEDSTLFLEELTRPTGVIEGLPPPNHLTKVAQLIYQKAYVYITALKHRVTQATIDSWRARCLDLSRWLNFQPTLVAGSRWEEDEKI